MATPRDPGRKCYELTRAYKLAQALLVLEPSLLLVVGIYSGQALFLVMWLCAVVGGAWTAQMAPPGPIYTDACGLEVRTSWGLRRIHWSRIRRLEERMRFFSFRRTTVVDPIVKTRKPVPLG